MVQDTLLNRPIVRLSHFFQYQARQNNFEGPQAPPSSASAASTYDVAVAAIGGRGCPRGGARHHVHPYFPREDCRCRPPAGRGRCAHTGRLLWSMYPDAGVEGARLPVPPCARALVSLYSVGSAPHPYSHTQSGHWCEGKGVEAIPHIARSLLPRSICSPSRVFLPHRSRRLS